MADLSRDTLRETVIDAILAVAPEADVDALPPGRPWREALEVDSFDFLNILVDLEKRLGVSVPESDYHELVTLEGLLDYLESRLAA
ncbi:acyl carrier protein [Halomonas campaniensis]|uniref:Acyl carrier protein n=1 Tax=Halomonas campaniensis TaxID=213554 RepID=A0A7W5PBU0_9GAMM|nr:acyl carrier protein [Halomonas campaniensis]MBB3332075.1 acyl carrier protein [Halomonas campaniensis]